MALSRSMLPMSDAELAQQPTTYQSRVHLARFWKAVKKGRPRMALLQKFAALKLTGPLQQAHQTPAWMRAYYTRHRPQLRNAQCFVCRSIGYVERHHVIQIQHGGRNIRPNIVPLCRPCHATVHPWLQADSRRQTRATKKSVSTTHVAEAGGGAAGGA